PMGGRGQALVPRAPRLCARRNAAGPQGAHAAPGHGQGDRTAVANAITRTARAAHRGSGACPFGKPVPTLPGHALAAHGLPGTRACAGGTISAPGPAAVAARQMALTQGLLTALRDIHRHAAARRDPSCGTAFVDDVTADDVHSETIARLARAAPRIDGDAPA